MAQLIFRFNSQDIIHNYQQGEQISSILQSFCHNVGIKRDNFAFLCNGTVLNDQSIIQSLTPNNNNQIIILVTDIGTSPPTKPVMRQSESIICPICKESIVLSVRDFKVSLFKCKNGHRMDNIPLSKFKETQNIDISKILCGECKSSKANIYENKMHFCVKCNKNLCPLCKRTHDETHKIVKYENKFFICEKDFGKFNNYCSTCDKAFCSFCENEHDRHNKMTFGTIMGNMQKIIDLQKMLKNDVGKLKSIIKVITNILNKVSENLDAYFNINETIINTIKKEHMNYEQMTSLNEININEIQKYLMGFINSNDVIRIINGIFEMYKRMENIHEINLQKMIEDENEKEKKNVNNENNNQNINNNMINKEQVALQNNNPPQNNKENNNNIINTKSNNQNNNIAINNNGINENKINSNIITNNINNNNQINNNQIQNNNIINTNVNNNNQINNNIENINRINNNIINTNNIINNNNNSNQTSNQNTNQGNNNINLNLRPYTRSEELRITTEEENIIRQEIAEKNHLISESLDISNLINEYRENQQYINHVKTIANKYKSFRKIRRDGDCFYRGYIYRIFEYICMKNKTELFNKMLSKIDEARDLARKNLLDIDEFYHLFFGKFSDCFYSFIRNEVSCRDYLDNLFNDNNINTCNSLVLFIRYSIAGYLRENKSLYKEYVEQDYDDWIKNEVIQLNKEADHVQIVACVNCFDIGVKIENLTADGVESKKFPEGRDEKDIFITFLLTPGHYDLLYDN